MEQLIKVHFVKHPFLSNRKGSHDPKPILPKIGNPKFVYEEHNSLY